MFKLIETIIAGKIQSKQINNRGANNFRGQLELYSEGCIKCNKCVQACPTGTIRLNAVSGLPEIDYKNCIFCGICVDVCPQDVLKHTPKDVDPIWAGASAANIETRIKSRRGRSLAIRHFDAGSCNACDFEMGELSNPLYDLHHYGMYFVASPRHADLLMVTGVVTRNLEQALVMTYEAMQEPKIVMAVGACPNGGGVFGDTYATAGPLNKILPVDIAVPGCPPRPAAMLLGLAAAAELYAKKKK